MWINVPEILLQIVQNYICAAQKTLHYNEVEGCDGSHFYACWLDTGFNRFVHEEGPKGKFINEIVNMVLFWLSESMLDFEIGPNARRACLYALYILIDFMDGSDFKEIKDNKEDLHVFYKLYNNKSFLFTIEKIPFSFDKKNNFFLKNKRYLTKKDDTKQNHENTLNNYVKSSDLVNIESDYNISKFKLYSILNKNKNINFEKNNFANILTQTFRVYHDITSLNSQDSNFYSNPKTKDK